MNNPISSISILTDFPENTESGTFFLLEKENKLYFNINNKWFSTPDFFLKELSKNIVVKEKIIFQNSPYISQKDNFTGENIVPLNYITKLLEKLSDDLQQNYSSREHIYSDNLSGVIPLKNIGSNKPTPKSFLQGDNTWSSKPSNLFLVDKKDISDDNGLYSYSDDKETAIILKHLENNIKIVLDEKKVLFNNIFTSENNIINFLENDLLIKKISCEDGSEIKNIDLQNTCGILPVSKGGIGEITEDGVLFIENNVASVLGFVGEGDIVRNNVEDLLLKNKIILNTEIFDFIGEYKKLTISSSSNSNLVYSLFNETIDDTFIKTIRIGSSSSKNNLTKIIIGSETNNSDSHIDLAINTKLKSSVEKYSVLSAKNNYTINPILTNNFKIDIERFTSIDILDISLKNDEMKKISLFVSPNKKDIVFSNKFVWIRDLVKFSELNKPIILDIFSYDGSTWFIK